jgi:hypothetical protein
MNLHLIPTHFLAVYAVIAASMLVSIAVSLYLSVFAKSKSRHEQKRFASDVAGMQEEIAKLRSAVARLSAEANQTVAAPPVVAPGLNMHKASEALRMCRRGCDDHTIAGALGMTQAELKLIRKAHPATPGAGAYSETAQASSSRAVYSAEA